MIKCILKEVDLLLHLENSLLKINIEINSEYTKGIINRNVIYLSKISSNNYTEGDTDYSHIWSSRQINFNTQRKSNKFINEYVFKEKTNNDILTDIIEVDVINMLLIDKLDYNSLNLKEKMVYNLCMLLSTTDVHEFERLSELIMEKEDSKDLVKQVEEMSSDDRYVVWDHDYNGAAKRVYNTVIHDTKEEGIKEGIKEGIEQKTKESAIEFHKNGAPDELIINSLHITQEKLSEYLKEK